MVFRNLETKDIPKAKKLWKQAFSDTDSYIDFNFENNLSLQNSMAIFEQDYLVCMLFMMPKTIMVNNKGMKTQFIAGVSTDNDYRYKGYAKKLMESTHNMLKDAGFPFVFLYPFNHDFYRKLGYQTVNNMNKVAFDGGAKSFSDYSLDLFDGLNEELLDRVLKIYNNSCKRLDSYFARGKEDFSKIINTLFVDDGKVCIIKQEKKDVGYVFYYVAEDKIECAESLFLDQETTKAYTIMAEKCGFIYCNPEFELENSNLEEYAMINIFDKEYEFLLNSNVFILEQY